MNIERDTLQKQCSQISCLTDDLIKLTRRLSTTTLKASQNAENTTVVFGFNTLLISCIGKSIATYALILDSLLGLVGAETTYLETVTDNLVTLQQQPHSGPSVG